MMDLSPLDQGFAFHLTRVSRFRSRDFRLRVTCSATVCGVEVDPAATQRSSARLATSCTARSSSNTRACISRRCTRAGSYPASQSSCCPDDPAAPLTQLSPVRVRMAADDSVICLVSSSPSKVSANAMNSSGVARWTRRSCADSSARRRDPPLPERTVETRRRGAFTRRGFAGGEARAAGPPRDVGVDEFAWSRTWPANPSRVPG